MVRAVLHLGAHRCATTTFQTFLELNRDALARRGWQVWTPSDTRKGLLDGLTCKPGEETGRMAEGISRVQDRLDAMGRANLLVSEENMIGAPFDNLNSGSLYPGFGARMSRFHAAFNGHVSGIGLAIRRYDDYWASLLSYSVLRGYQMPSQPNLEALTYQRRRWRHLIQELRKLFPNTPINIWHFEDLAPSPCEQFNVMTGAEADAQDFEVVSIKKNYSRDTSNLARLLRDADRFAAAQCLPKRKQRWMPFSEAQQRKMQVDYAFDIDWLSCNVDPFVRYLGNAVSPRHSLDAGGHYDPRSQVVRDCQERAAG